MNSKRKDRFTNVYKNNSWGCKESFSGPGSTLKNASHDMHFLKAKIKDIFPLHSRISIIDVPCGDMNWMSVFLEDLQKDYEVSYTGLDIVDELIKVNTEKYPQHQFKTFDIVQERLLHADIIICRDLLNHLSSTDVKKILNNFKESKSAYLFISNNREWENTELSSEVRGNSRHLDIEKEPYHFGTAKEYNGHLGLWINSYE